MAGSTKNTDTLRCGTKLYVVLYTAILPFSYVAPEEVLARNKITDYDHGISHSASTQKTANKTTKSYLSLLHPFRHPVIQFSCLGGPECPKYSLVENTGHVAQGITQLILI